MLHLAYSSDDANEQSMAFDREVIRFGSDPNCDVRFLGSQAGEVSARHGAIIRELDRYILLAGDDSGVWVNGRRIQRIALQGGERIRVGAPDGPEIRVLEATGARQNPLTRPSRPNGPENQPTMVLSAEQVKDLLRAPAPTTAPPHEEEEEEDKTAAFMPVDESFLVDLNPTGVGQASKTIPASAAEPAVPPPLPPPVATSPPLPSYTIPPHVIESAVLEAAAGNSLPLGASDPFTSAALKALRRPQEEVSHWLARAQQEIRRARQKSAGRSSGQTMVIMASALAGIRQSAEGRVQRTRRNLLLLAAASLVVVVGLVGIIWMQQRQITQLISDKKALDSEIESVFASMATETDEAKLAALEARLQVLMGSAADKLVQVRKASATRAAELTQPVDELEGEIRKILRSFNAETYAIPPIFKEELQRHISALKSTPALRAAYLRKRRYWPQIEQALSRNQLPSELGYIAFAESAFEPSAVNARSGASGMWQLMEEAAKNCGISVGGPKDERFDPARSSQAASCYLSKLLIEFGQESFMLALASYNRGENGVRRALHKLAREPGGYRKRDFWHLYRLKLLPPETREYVPKVLAAAIVFNEPEKYGLVPSR